VSKIDYKIRTKLFVHDDNKKILPKIHEMH